MPGSGADRRPAAVQALLTDLFRAPVVVERWERLEPWAIARVLLGGWRCLSDDLGLALAPRVIAADVPAGFLVLEDLAPRIALDRRAARGAR